MKADGTKKNDNPTGGEEFEDVSSNNDSVETGVVEVDVGLKLIQKHLHGTLHVGQGKGIMGQTWLELKGVAYLEL